MTKEIIFAVILISFSIPVVIMTILWETLSQHENPVV